ncbi:LCP family protein [Leucobacter chinensis]|uniref:LCP family protein n=1 Tax=Leucobacter chinensis TaxID=2851010 RepID=UPI001C231E9E
MNSSENNPLSIFDELEVAEEAPGPVKKKRRWLRNTIIIILVVLVALAGVVGWYLLKLNKSFNQIELIDNPFPTSENRVADVEGPRNILLLGSDTRGEIGDDIDDISGQRSDTIMVAHIPANSKSVQIMSIMRDNWVELPNGQEAKINAALAVGGVPMLVESVEGLIQDQIDHVVVIDFTGFEGLTDALGGVTLNNPIAFSDRGADFAEGKITLNGEDALKFVRARYAFSDGDYSRVRNQQLYMKAVLNELMSKETLTNPMRLQDAVSALAPFVTADAGFTSSYLAGEALELRDVRGKDVTFFTSPTNGTGTSADGQSIVVPDWEAWERLAERFKNDTVRDWNPDTRM